jgi:hypothetical protein
MDDFEVAEAIYRAAVARWATARITLRQGARIMHESGQPRVSLDHLVGAGEQRGRVR